MSSMPMIFPNVSFLQNPPEIGELIGIPNAGKLVHRLVHSFPQLVYVIF